MNRNIEGLDELDNLIDAIGRGERPHQQAPPQEPIPEPVKEQKTAETPDTPMVPKKGLRSQLNELRQRMDEVQNVSKAKKKSFVLPWRARAGSKQLAKKNQLLVFVPRTNKNFTVLKAKIDDDGYVNIFGKTRKVQVDQVFLWEGKIPSIILPEWDLAPFGTKDYHDAVKDNRLVDHQTTIIRAIEERRLQESPKAVSGKMWIIIVVVGIIAAYLLFGNQSIGG